MDRRRFLLGSACAATSMVMLGRCLPGAQTVAPQKLKWETSLAAARKVADEQNKLLLIVFGASWCTYCHKLERETLTDKRIVTMLERDFVPVRLDFDRDTKAVKILEVEQIPATVVLTAQADLLLHTIGYFDPKKYEKQLQIALIRRGELSETRQAKASN